MSNNQHDLSTHHDQYGITTAAMVNETFAQGVERGVLLMRHSAREFRRDIHDLENPLTDHGRGLAKKLGECFSAGIYCRAYGSPPHRCVETGEFVLAGVIARSQRFGFVSLQGDTARHSDGLRLSLHHIRRCCPPHHRTTRISTALRTPETTLS